MPASGDRDQPLDEPGCVTEPRMMVGPPPRRMVRAPPRAGVSPACVQSTRSRRRAPPHRGGGAGVLSSSCVEATAMTSACSRRPPPRGARPRARRARRGGCRARARRASAPRSSTGAGARTMGSPICTRRRRRPRPARRCRPRGRHARHAHALLLALEVPRALPMTPGSAPAASRERDALADQHRGVPGADLPDEQHPRGVDVLDDQADLVDVADERDARGAAGVTVANELPSASPRTSANSPAAARQTSAAGRSYSRPRLRATDCPAGRARARRCPPPSWAER